MAHSNQQEIPSFPELWLRLRELRVDENPQNVNRAENIGWLPPECPGQFIPEPAPWHIWSPGAWGQDNRLTPMGGDRPVHVQMYGSTSIFYSTELHSFLEVPYDVTIEHVSDRKREYEDDGWSRISFMHGFSKIVQRPNLWSIGHGHKKKQIDQRFWLSDSWDELLLPGSFANGPWQKNRTPTCELGGSLPIIFGLIALAASPQDRISMIRESFRPQGNSDYVPTWRTRTRRPRDQGRIPKRGLVVDVAFDKTRLTSEHIEAWEDGRYGPILTSNTDHNRPPSPAHADI